MSIVVERSSPPKQGLTLQRCDIDGSVALRILIHRNSGGDGLSPDAEPETKNTIEAGWISLCLVDDLAEFLDFDRHTQVRVCLDPVSFHRDDRLPDRDHIPHPSRCSRGVTFGLVTDYFTGLVSAGLLDRLAFTVDDGFSGLAPCVRLALGRERCGVDGAEHVECGKFSDDSLPLSFRAGGRAMSGLRSAGELGFVAIELSLAGIALDFLQSGWLGCGSGHSDISGGFAMLFSCP
jgi:hypothetical protein